MSDMLSSWKEIAQFFGKGVRTVQRWEKTLDLPIHRPPGAPSNVVLAKESDLEEWMNRGLVGGHASTERQDNVARSFDAIQNAISDLARNRHSADFHERVNSMRNRIEDLKKSLDAAVDGEGESHNSIAA